MENLPPRVLSGIQPSGTLHLGNYFGAIQQHIALQDEYPGECLFFIADYHALTTTRDAAALRQNSRDVATTYLALGLDPSKATLFRQSDVPEVTELTWMLSTVTGMGLLERATSYKDKINNGIKPSVGLFTYPILMASDILIYRSSMVPVGKDQIQHVEMTQDMATYFNQAFAADSPVLRRPEWKLSKAPYVPGLDGRKMSKSYGNLVPLFEKGKKLKKLVGRVVTDSTELGTPLPTAKREDGQGYQCNVLSLLALFLDEAALEEVLGFYEAGARGGEPFGYGHAKMMLKDAIEAEFAEARERREALVADPTRVDQVLDEGAQRARALARETLDDCKRACGLL
jgi:tryptophanyl-tRNA synthetase